MQDLNHGMRLFLVLPMKTSLGHDQTPARERTPPQGTSKHTSLMIDRTICVVVLYKTGNKIPD